MQLGMQEYCWCKEERVLQGCSMHLHDLRWEKHAIGMSLIALTFLSSTLRQPLELLSCFQPRFQPLSKYPILSKQVAEVFLSPGTSYLRHGVSHNKTKEKKQQKTSVNSGQCLSLCFRLCNPYSVNKFISACLIWHLLQAIHSLKTPAMNKHYQPLVDIWLGS